MAYKPIRMDIIKHIKAASAEGLGIKAIARQLKLSKNTVKKYLTKFSENGLLDVSILEDHHAEVIYSGHFQQQNIRHDTILNLFPDILKDLSRKGRTREHAWNDYIVRQPDGYSYGEFCRKIKAFKRTQNATLNLNHKPGDVLQVDYAGSKLRYYDKDTNEPIEVQVLICTLPSSGLIFVIASLSQCVDDFVFGISQALSFIGGCPKVILSDNLKSFVVKSNRNSPTFNQSCVQLAMHYGVELDATRVGKPKDKASVERHVQIAYNNIYAHLHDTKAYSIQELNSHILRHVNVLNDKVRTDTKMSRQQFFDDYEKENLRPLPPNAFLLSRSIKATVQGNYHILLGVDKHYYSVPYMYVGKSVDVVYDRDNVEIFLGTRRIAFHKRSYDSLNNLSTLDAHRKENHLNYLNLINLTPQDFIDKASAIGPNTAWAMQYIVEPLNNSPRLHKVAEGLLRLTRHYDKSRIEQICTYLRPSGVISLDMINNVLSSNIDTQHPHIGTPFNIPNHDNIRGASSFQ
jgi:transposase